MPTTHEAADRLGIKPRSVVKAVKRGLIRAEKRGRDYWIEDEEVERYARERRPSHRPKREQ
jgi:excisionase family DNA binding protein